ncbi:MAG: efflux RND transporter permease subunit, partial [bacterium]|nr:efflux RND transporter permease subunit [bacterium]
EVRDRVERLKLHLPEEVERVFLRRSSSDFFSMMRFTLLTDENENELAHWARKRLQPLLLRLPGVADVEVSGKEEGTVYVEFDQNALRRSGLSLYQVVNHLKRQSVKLSVGELPDGKSTCLVRFENEFDNLEELRDAVVGPNALRLREVARVMQQETGTGTGLRIDGKRGVFVSIQKKSEANTIDTCKSVRDELDRLRQEPSLQGVDVFVFEDHSDNITAAIDMLGAAGRNGGLLALLVLFLFMRRVRPTLIVATSIPISLVVALIGIYFLGMTLNTVTMASMIICVGLLVDNSIVVMENILRHQELGLNPRESAELGAREVSLAITAATLTTVVVFVPVFYMETNEMSIHMREFSRPVAIAILSSLVVSLTIIPLAASKLKKRRRSPEERDQLNLTRKPGLIRRILGIHPIRWMHASYSSILAWVMRWRLATVALIGVVAAVTYAIPYRNVGMQQLPSVDLRRIEIRANFDPNMDFDHASEVFENIESLLNERRDRYGIENIYVNYGNRGGRVRAYLVQLEGNPAGPRALVPTKQVREELAAALPRLVAGGEVRIDATENRSSGYTRISLRMRGRDTGVLASYGEELRRRLSYVDNVVDAEVETDQANKEIQLQIDEDVASGAGISPYVVARTVDFALRGTRLFNINRNGQEVPVHAQFQAKDRKSLSNLDNVSLLNRNGVLIPLNRLVDKVTAPSPKAINRIDGKNVITVSAIATTDDLARVKRDIDAQVATLSLPQGYSIVTGEELTELDANLDTFTKALILAVILIYIVMGALFESYVLPLSILTSVPLAFIGVYWSMFITRTQMDAVALVGAILMCGVVVNNGIVIVDHINQLRKRGYERLPAVLTASHDRFRPVMMTALTTIGGCIPLAMGSRLGNVAFHSLGRALIGGLTTGTVLTLFIVPLFYSLIDDLQGWLGNFFANLAGAGTRSAAPHRETLVK